LTKLLLYIFIYFKKSKIYDLCYDFTIYDLTQNLDLTTLLARLSKHANQLVVKAHKVKQWQS